METLLNDCIESCNSCALKSVSEKLDCVDCCLLCESVCRALKNCLLLNSKKSIQNNLKKACAQSLKDCIEHCSHHNNPHCRKCSQSCSKLLAKLTN